MKPNELRKLVDERLKELLSTCRQKELREAMEYSVFAGGKRLRPLLLIAAYESLTGENSPNFDCAVDFGCALEMIHTSSLIHDDLPAMDNDDLRRGKPTSHKQFGEAMAILAGDGLINCACEVMLAADADATLLLNAMRIIADASGANGMIAGQVLDIAASENAGDSSLSPETLAEIHALKTGALFKAALVAGAAIAESTTEVLDDFARLGEILGKAFQLLDDILEITASEEKLGKQKSDARNNKLTYVSVYGLERAKTDYKTLCAEALAQLNNLPVKTDSLLQVVREVLDREY